MRASRNWEWGWVAEGMASKGWKGQPKVWARSWDAGGRVL